MTERQSTTRVGESQVAPRAKGFFYPRGPIGLLLIHGFAGSIADLEDAGAKFAASNFSVLGVRLAGHGSSPGDLQRTSAEDWVASAARGLEELQRTARQVVIIGDSFGGNIGLELASRYPTLVRGVVLLSTPTALSTDWIKRLAIPLIRLVHPFHRKRWVTSAMVQEHLEKGSYLRIPLTSYGSMLRFLAKQRPKLRSLHVPVILVALADDQVVSPQHATRLYRSLTNARKQLYWVKGAYHHPLLSPQRDAIVSMVMSFARSVVADSTRSPFAAVAEAGGLGVGAGDRTRTGDFLLGKQTFYH